jgi:hypothetical protein
MFDITIDPTPLSYLRRLHQNLAIESTNNDSILTLTDEEDIERYMKKFMMDQ